MWFILLILTALFLLYKYLSSSYGYWKKRGVPHLPVSILFGNMTESVLAKKSLAQVYTDVYKAFPNLLYVGFYKIREPAVVVRDPELIKDILIKDFRSFHDNDFHIDEKVDPIFGKNPFTLKGERWKVARNQLVPCFSNKKLKAMFPLYEETGNKLVKYINNFQGNNKYDGFDAKELATRFTTELVANCMLGLEGRSFEKPKPELWHTIQQIFHSSTWVALKHVCVIIVPPLANFFDFKFFPNNVAIYIRRLVDQAIKYRKKNNIIRGDFLDSMLEIQTKLGENHFTGDDITAHIGGVFGDGTETSSITLSYLLFELATHKDVQTKLRNCIDEILLKNGNKFNFEELFEIEYLDNVLRESLRLHPPFPYLAKNCTKTTQWSSPFGIGKGSDVTIEEGMSIFIPVDGIHHDPKFYSNPNEFQPDRFSKENKNNLTDCTFLSFGEGPRYCLGEKFGVIQVKTAILFIISNFDVSLNTKTIVPLQTDPKYFLLKPIGDIHLNLIKRH